MSDQLDKLSFNREGTSHHFLQLPHTQLQGWAKRQATGLGKFVPVVAYHFCLALPAAFTQPVPSLLTVEECKWVCGLKTISPYHCSINGLRGH